MIYTGLQSALHSSLHYHISTLTQLSLMHFLAHSDKHGTSRLEACGFVAGNKLIHHGYLRSTTSIWYWIYMIKLWEIEKFVIHWHHQTLSMLSIHA